MAQKQYLNYEGLARVISKLEDRYGTAIQFKGTVADIASLPTIANTKVGSMYNVTAEGTTTADFVEGGGFPFRAGDNVVAVNTGTDELPVMKWDILSGVFDFSDRLQFGTTMPASPTAGQTFLYLGETTYTYTAVTPEGIENPATEGWYELNGEAYTLTTDTTVDSGKTYYTREEEYVKGVIYVYDGTTWVAQSSGDVFVPITSAEIDALFA